MSTITTTLAIASLWLQSVSAALTACPVAETSWSSGNGPTYLICPNTDYQLGGRSLQVVQNVASTTACAKICATDTRCSKAVYDKGKRICHVKDPKSGVRMPWEAYANFDTIRIDTVQLAEGAFLARCPFPQIDYRTSRGSTYNVCRNTDYVGASVKIVKQVTTVNACADLCGTTTGCNKAVFDTKNNVCHIKGAEPATSLFWVKNQQFTTITLPKQLKPAQAGQWSDLVRLPLIPVAAYVVPQFPQADRLMFFSSWGTDAFGGASGMTQFGDLNFATGKIAARQVANTHHDMFCPAISQLADGRILVQGGSNAEAVSIYDPSTNAFTRAADMKVARGYQTSTILSNGKVFTIGGAYSGPREAKNGEIYDPKIQAWTYLPGTEAKPILTKDHEGIWREDNHAWLFGWKKGSVFQAGPGKDQHWFGTEGKGSITKAATRDTMDAMCGIFVMYDAIAGKILSAAGAQDYTNSAATAHAHITTIGEPYKPSTVERIPDLAFPRGFSNAVVLPDGSVLVTGGQRKSLVFTNTDSVLIPELFNPKTKTWTQLAPHAVPRNYHSISILLPDSRVFIGGGGLCYVNKIKGSTAGCDKTVDHADGEYFSPPFLFNADGTPATRPVVSNLTQKPVKVGATLTFTASEFGSASLVRMGSVTHSVNSDQRRVPLNNVTRNGKTVSVKLPTDSGILLPGFYYLFVLSAKGTPSMGMTVHVVL
ncbi:galactose oxidase [Paraphaeosphaeria sporulosa]|uniref:Galactose oxidase n=1 Tax=Paraphaeosphaeria sporulosa TaxID=1460663 RepID=A0A177CID1_9PLEO|nr:galactose oxidase [Paraphaeosphaeria sporulosa]OAG07066.1 galactose oxidase [Paraphaeosphaeria sporulosa]